VPNHVSINIQSSSPGLPRSGISEPLSFTGFTTGLSWPATKFQPSLQFTSESLSLPGQLLLVTPCLRLHCQITHFYPPRRPGFVPRSGHVGFVVDSVTLGQVFSEYFCFPCQFSFHRLLHIHHLSSGAGAVGQLVADVPS
jgi:hypothetical protein